MESPEPEQHLVDGLKRAFDAFLGQPKERRPVRGQRLVRRPVYPASRSSEEHQLEEFIAGVFSEWPEPALTVARANGDERRIAGLMRPNARLARVIPFDEVLKLLRTRECPDTLTLARRVADHLSGPSQPIWQYIAVSVRPVYPVALHDGWQLAPVDGANDALLPLGYPTGYSHPFTPEAFHLEHDYGAIRRVSGESDVLGEGSARENRELTLPMLLLNLATDHPVHAGLVYYIDPATGRTLPSDLRSEVGDLHFHPKELHRWEHTNGHWVTPRQGRVVSAAETGYLSRFSLELGVIIQRLEVKRRDRLLRAADQYLIVAHRTPGSDTEIPAVPAMHEPEAAFRWVSAIEALLSAEDGDHNDLIRKTAQRAAVLVGDDDEERLGIHKLVRSAYHVRSAYVHGSDGKTIDLAALRTLARKIVIAWIILAADAHGKDLPELLDNALLSSVRLGEVRRQVSHFWERVKAA